MCARFALAITPEQLQLEFGLEVVPVFSARYNIAPSQNVPVIIQRADKPFLTFRTWGLVPAWAKNRNQGHRLINAKSETAPELPAFKSAFEKRRCIIPATGFFEWKDAEEGEFVLSGDAKKPSKQPLYFHSAESQVMGFAGLYERHYGGQDQPFDSFTILTTEPNELIAPIHDRMPVILGREDYRAWLDPETPIAIARSMLKPSPASELDFYAVSRDVNRPDFERSEAIARDDKA